MSASIVIRLCPICRDSIGEERRSVFRRDAPAIDGLCFKVGYSKGGWGQRRDVVEFAEEVCHACFSELLPLAQAFEQKFASLKDSRKVKISLEKANRGDQEGHKP